MSITSLNFNLSEWVDPNPDPGPGGDNPGGDNPGGDNPGGDNPGGNNPSDGDEHEGGDGGSGSGTGTGEEDEKPSTPSTSEGPKDSNPGSANTGFYTEQQAIAEIQNQRTQILVSHIVPVVFVIFIFMFFAFMLPAIIKKLKKRDYFRYGLSHASFTRFQTLATVAASFSLIFGVITTVLSYTQFQNNIAIDTSTSGTITVSADIIGTDNPAYVQDYITVPASDYGYNLFISSKDANTDLILEGSNGETGIDTISTIGPLSDNTWGFSLVDPAEDATKFRPLPSSQDRVEIKSESSATAERRIPIWYGVRAKTATAGAYKIDVKYEAFGGQDVDVSIDEMTAEICETLTEEGGRYEFTNSQGQKQEVRKLKDGNCWTNPVPNENPTEDPEAPAVICPTGWHAATDNDYTNLNIFYPPETTEDEFINGLRPAPNGCVADFDETEVTFEDPSGETDPEDVPDDIDGTDDDDDYEIEITIPRDIVGDGDCNFLGYSLFTDGREPIFRPGETITVSSPKVKLYAIWRNTTKTAKAILDSDGLLNFVYDYCTVGDVNNDVDSYKTDYAENHATITDVYKVPTVGISSQSQSSWYNNTNVSVVNFEDSFKNFRPTSTQNWFHGLTNLVTINNLKNINMQNVTSTRSMFANASALTSVTIPNDFDIKIDDMSSMFYGASSLSTLSLPANFGKSATDMDYMFYSAPISSITSPGNFSFPDGFGSNADSMQYMFHRTTVSSPLSFPTNFGRNATSIDHIFREANINALTLPTDFGVSAEDCSSLFSKATILSPLSLPSGFCDSAMTMQSMFNGASVPSITFPSGFGVLTDDTAYMFKDANIPSSLSFQNNFASNATYMQGMFDGATTSAFLSFPDGFGKSAENMSEMFYATSSLESVSFPSGFGQDAIDMSRMFAQTPSLAEVSFPAYSGGAATNMSGMFEYATSLTSITFPAGFGSAATDMSSMFEGASSLVSITSSGNFSFPDGFGSAAEDMSFMFYGVSSLSTLSLPSNFGSAAETMNDMFYEASNLSSITSSGNFPFPDGFGSAATNMSGMFGRDYALTSLSFPDGFGSAATNMISMFESLSSLTDISFPADFGSNVRDARAMFACEVTVNCNLRTITFPAGFASNVTNTFRMFEGSSLWHIYVDSDEVDWDNGNVENSTRMFNVRGTLTSHSIQPNAADDITYAHVGTKNGVLGYFELAPAQQGPLNSPSPSQQNSNNPDATPEENTNEGPSPLGVFFSTDESHSNLMFLIIIAATPILVGVFATALFFVVKEHRRQLQIRAAAIAGDEPTETPAEVEIPSEPAVEAPAPPVSEPIPAQEPAPIPEPTPTPVSAPAPQPEPTPVLEPESTPEPTPTPEPAPTTEPIPEQPVPEPAQQSPTDTSIDK